MDTWCLGGRMHDQLSPLARKGAEAACCSVRFREGEIHRMFSLQIMRRAGVL